MALKDQDQDHLEKITNPEDQDQSQWEKIPCSDLDHTKDRDHVCDLDFDLKDQLSFPISGHKSSPHATKMHCCNSTAVNIRLCAVYHWESDCHVKATEHCHFIPYLRGPSQPFYHH